MVAEKNGKSYCNQSAQNATNRWQMFWTVS